MKDATRTMLQAKVFDFALTELVYRNRESFQPLWTIDSWVKFLIWMALNAGLPGDQKSLEQLTESLGHPLTSRMRRIFFERSIGASGLKVIADPADLHVLVMPIDGSASISIEKTAEVLTKIGLDQSVLCDQTSWQILDAVIAIPWNSVQK